MSEFLKDKPSSRVLRPPGGASSNIFGGSDECTEQSRVVKPTSTYKSSVFDPEPPKLKSGTHPGVKSSNIFAMGTENVTQNSPVKVSKTHQSSIFADSEKTSNPGKTDSSNVRYDPITGNVIGQRSSITSESNDTSGKKVTTNGDSSPTNTSPSADVTPTNHGEPRLGPVKNESGIRCAQPPGGKSSFSLF